jgi:hypothetical protein
MGKDYTSLSSGQVTRNYLIITQEILKTGYFMDMAYFGRWSATLKGLLFIMESGGMEKGMGKEKSIISKTEICITTDIGKMMSDQVQESLILWMGIMMGIGKMEKWMEMEN